MSEWIEITHHTPNDEERAIYGDEFSYIYDCELPNDGTEVLITTKYGYVTTTIFYNDDCAYFEGYEDDGEVIAWRYLPSPYRKAGEV